MKDFFNIWRLLLILSLIFYVLNSIFYIFYAESSFDEGNYLYKGYLYASGKAKLYSFNGIWSEYMPGSYLPFGYSQLLIGPNFYVGRFISFVFGFLTIIATYFLANKIAGKIAGALSVAFIVFNSTTVQAFSVVAPYSLASFFLVLSVLTFVSSLNIKVRTIFSLLFMFLAAFTRSSMIPTYLFFVLYTCFVNRQNKNILLLTIVFSLIIPSLLLLPFYPGILHIFLQLPIISSFAVFFGYPKDFFIFPFSNKIDPFKIATSFLEFFKYYQIWFIPLFSLILLGILCLKRGRAGFIKKALISDRSSMVLVIFLFIFNVISHFIGAYGHCPRCAISYFNFYSPLGAVILAVMVGTFIGIAKDELFSDFIFVISLLILLFVGLATLSNIFMRKFSQTSLQMVINVADDIKRVTSKEDFIFSLSEPHYLFLSGRTGFGPLINKHYSLRASENSDILGRIGLWTMEMAEGWLANDSDWVLISQPSLDYFSFSNEDAKTRIENQIKKNFILVKTYPDAWHGPLYLYKRNLPESK